ncbi:ABC transporter ATP-binding protein [Paraconexibacter sp.]|uniref:ABC transporter ATP-binding protein n=1 Tax=Paraconexibacter sp. TaxID=2949640 RepID=UPI003562B9ED
MSAPGAAPIIETDRLTKTYGAARGIADLTLDVMPGEAFGFLGPNGAGKTTTIRTLLDLLHPTSGSARVFGLDSRRDSLAIRARVGNLPGDFTYEERMTGREMLREFATLRGMRDLGRAGELAERFEAALDRPLHELSRGNRQKVGLIQALFHDPELLILDEPTSGLDPLMQEEFLSVIAEHRDRGGTVFLSSHVLDEVERACDRVGIIRDGRLIAVEDVDEMRARAYREVTVSFDEIVPRTEIERVDGVRGLTSDDTSMRFRVHGDLDPVVKELARHRVRDIEITRPALEELFLAYYEQERVT